MNRSRARALAVLADGPIDNAALVVLGLRKKTLQALSEAGLAKFRPYGKPPTWAITLAGRHEFAANARSTRALPAVPDGELLAATMPEAFGAPSHIKRA